MKIRLPTKISRIMVIVFISRFCSCSGWSQWNWQVYFPELAHWESGPGKSYMEQACIVLRVPYSPVIRRLCLCLHRKEMGA